MRTHRPSPDPRPRGFTLVEVVVTLVLLGFLAGLGAVAWRAPETTPDARGALARVIATARSTAMRRAEALELRLDARGDWTLTAEGVDANAIMAGHLEAAGPTFVVRIDALGACTPRSEMAWDANRCETVVTR